MLAPCRTSVDLLARRLTREKNHCPFGLEGQEIQFDVGRFIHAYEEVCAVEHTVGRVANCVGEVLEVLSGVTVDRVHHSCAAPYPTKVICVHYQKAGQYCSIALAGVRIARVPSHAADERPTSA